MVDDARLPPCAVIRRGVLLQTITEAVVRLRDPHCYGATAYWPDARIFEMFHDAHIGLIVFDGDRFVALFYDRDNTRKLSPTETWPFLAGMPAELLPLVGSDVLSRLDISEEDEPPLYVVSAAFWCRGAGVEAAEPWPEVLRNGSFLLRDLVATGEAGRLVSESGWEILDADEAALVDDWYRRKLAHGDGPLELSRADRARLNAVTLPSFERIDRKERDERARYAAAHPSVNRVELMADLATREEQLAIARRELSYVGIKLP